MSIKVAQEVVNQRKPPPRHKPREVAYPDYNKSLVTQRHRSPLRAGGERAAQTGLTGAVLGALIARIMSNKPQNVVGGALAGGALGAVPGFVSGAREANSENSRLLFLRRRMGINEPGELDALLQHPELMSSLSQKKAAVSPRTVLKGLGLVAGAGGAGYALGSEGTSRLIGYHDDPAARHVGGYVNAANAAAVAGALFAAKNGKPQALNALLHPGALGGMAAMEVIPAALRSANRVADSSAAQASGQVSPSISRALNTSTARGAGIGAGAAGLAAIVSGLTRSKRDKEIQEGRGRAGMVTSDFLKYLLPAMVGGGVVGSLAKK